MIVWINHVLPSLFSKINLTPITVTHCPSFASSSLYRTTASSVFVARSSKRTVPVLIKFTRKVG